MKDDKIRWVEMTCTSAPEQFTLLADREQDRRRATRCHLNCASPFCPIKLSTHLVWGTWYASVYLHVVAWKLYSCKISRRCTRTTPYHWAQNISKSSVAHQYTALLTLPDLNMPLMEANAAYQGCLPSSKPHSHDSRSLTVRGCSIKIRRYRLYMQITQSQDCTHVAQSWGWNTISGFWECATQYQDCTNFQIVWNIYILLIKEWTCTTIDRLHTIAKSKRYLHKLKYVSVSTLVAGAKNSLATFVSSNCIQMRCGTGTTQAMNIR